MANSTRQWGYRGPDVPLSGLILYLDANTINSYPGAGNIWKDISGNNNVATLYNGVQFNSSYMTFDGNDDIATIPDSSLLRPTTLSLSSWFRRTNTPQFDCRVFAKEFSEGPPEISYGILINADPTRVTNNVIGFGLGFLNQNFMNVLSSNIQAPLNTWVNTTCTYDGYSMKIYVNGVLANSMSVSGTILYSTRTVYIGVDPAVFPLGFKGDAATAMIYNRALDASEVAQIFESTRSRFGI